MSEGVEEKVRQLLRAAMPTKKPAGQKRRSAPPSVQGTQVGGCNNQVVIVNATHLSIGGSVCASSSPVATLGNPQAAELHNLVDQIVEAEQAAGNEVPEWEAWKRLNDKMGVETMRDIPVERFGMARGYLAAWLRNTRDGVKPEAPQIRIGEVLDLAREIGASDLVVKFTEREFGTKMLKELDQRQLTRTYRYVLKIKESGKVDRR